MFLLPSTSKSVGTPFSGVTDWRVGVRPHMGQSKLPPPPGRSAARIGRSTMSVLLAALAAERVGVAGLGALSHPVIAASASASRARGAVDFMMKDLLQDSPGAYLALGL